MAVSVRMEPLLEQELERAARQLGVSKSQFIIDAVERALGRRDPHALLQRVQRQYGLQTPTAPPVVAEPASPHAEVYSSAALRDKLEQRHDAELRDWLAYQDARRRGQAWQPDDLQQNPAQQNPAQQKPSP